MPYQVSSIREEYKRFADAVYDGGEANFHEDQRRQIKQAFYAGAQVMFALMNHAAQDELSVEDGAKIAQGFADEIQTFFRTQFQLYEGKTKRIHL